MIDGEDAVQVLYPFQELVDVRNIWTGQPEIDELGCAINIRVALEGCNLASRQEQQLIEEGLQLAHRVEMRDSIVVADRNKVEASLGCGLHRFVEGTRNFLAQLTQARAVAVCVVHMQIPAIPCGAGTKRRLTEGGDSGRVGCACEEDFGGVFRTHTLSDIWNA